MEFRIRSQKIAVVIKRNGKYVNFNHILSLSVDIFRFKFMLKQKPIDHTKQYLLIFLWRH